MPIDQEAARAESRALVGIYFAAGMFERFPGKGGPAELASEVASPDEALAILARPPTSPSRYARRIDALTRYAYEQPADADRNRERIVTAFEQVGLASDVVLQLVDDAAAAADRGVPVEDLIDRFVASSLEGGGAEDWLVTITANLCKGVLVSHPLPTDPHETVARITTCFCVPDTDLTLEGLAEYIDPRTWPTCNGFWCSVNPTGPVQQGQSTWGGKKTTMSVTETVGDCGGLEIVVCLDVAIVENFEEGVLTMMFDLCRDENGKVVGNEQVDVDQGLITVTHDKDKKQICISSAKDIHFASDDSNGQVSAKIACAMGYGDQAVDMAFGCSGAKPDANKKIIACEAPIAPMTSA